MGGHRVPYVRMPGGERAVHMTEVAGVPARPEHHRREPAAPAAP
ncbi:hypothetical protein [Streptomyces sp. 35G-GA-8]|nr:hypothetical protein [Streptomyces sp. 35G-GA-8]